MSHNTWMMFFSLLGYCRIKSFSLNLVRRQRYNTLLLPPHTIHYKHNYISFQDGRRGEYRTFDSFKIPMNKQDHTSSPTEDDPWAAYTLRTDDDDEDDKDDDDSWLDKIPGARALAQDPSLVELTSSSSSSSTTTTNTLKDLSSSSSNIKSLSKDHFYSSFDDEKFISIQKEYSAKARGMSVAEYEQYEKQIKQSAADAVTGDKAYVQTQQVERKSTFITTVQQHLQHQQEVFDTMSSTFFHMKDNKDDVEHVQPVLKHITKRMIQQMMESKQEGIQRNKNTTTTTLIHEESADSKMYHILDVGCGTGSLFQPLLQAAKDARIQLKLTGVDISPKMIEYATIHAENVLDDFPSNLCTFDFETKDFIQYIMGHGYPHTNHTRTLIGYDKGIMDDYTMKHRNKYDAVVFNSCFGNFYDPVITLSAAAQCLRPNGIVVITHPLGADFVRKLNEEDPDSVPHHLPTILDFRKMTREQPLVVLDFIEDVDLLNVQKEIQNFQFYYASARKTSYQPLRSVLRLRGPVDKGYGRGGKKLGFPTANLPSRFFSNALEDIPNGVYFGWAVIEDGRAIRSDIRSGRNTWHKAVVNVGLSPTFVGEENREKIVEAHLIVEKDEIRGDFYNETMRLALSGFLRPEMKFNSFADLIAAITNDVANAKEALSAQPFVALRADPFLTDPCKRVNNTMVENGQVWIGKSGGDEIASWEWEDFERALRSTPMARWVI